MCGSWLIVHAASAFSRSPSGSVPEREPHHDRSFCRASGGTMSRSAIASLNACSFASPPSSVGTVPDSRMFFTFRSSSPAHRPSSVGSTPLSRLRAVSWFAVPTSKFARRCSRPSVVGSVPDRSE